MTMRSHRSRRSRGLAAVVILVVAPGANIALAANQLKGGHYSGSLDISPTVTVTFKVSSNGKNVTRFDVAPFFPNSCGSGGGPPKYISKPAKIKHGKFKAKVLLVTDTGSKIPAGVAKGKFGKHKSEAGTLRPSGLPANCTANFKYSTTGHK